MGHRLQWLLVTGLFVHAELCTHVHTCMHTPWWALRDRGRALLAAPVSPWHTQGLPWELPGQAALMQIFKTQYLQVFKAWYLG